MQSSQLVRLFFILLNKFVVMKTNHSLRIVGNSKRVYQED